MKNWMALVTMFGLLASLTTSQAQQADPDRLDELDARIEQTRQRLNLTDEQSVQIEPILESSFHASMLVLESHGIDMSVPREAAGATKLPGNASYWQRTSGCSGRDC